MRKKLAAILLCMCMVLTLLPVSASAATTFYFEPVGVHVGGNDISAGGTITGAAGTGVTAGTVSFSGGTLTLDNAKITGTTDFHLVSSTSSETQDKAGIYISPVLADPSESPSSEPCTLTINLVGDNVIEGQAGSLSSYGICAKNTKLVFTGTGTLKVTSAAITCNIDEGYATAHRSNPIYAYNGVEIGADCTIVAASGGFTQAGNSHCVGSSDPFFTFNLSDLVYSSTAVYSTSIGGTLIAYDNRTDINRAKYMRIGTGTVPNDPANTTSNPDGADTGDDQTPATRPTVTITYANGTVVTAPKVGETLKAKVESVPSDVSIQGYEWLSGDENTLRSVLGSGQTYTVGQDAVGTYIYLRVTFSDNSEALSSNRMQRVAAADGNTPDVAPTPPATGGHNRVFHVDAEKAESPKTADTGVMLYAALSLASLTGTAWWSRKRK